MNLSDRRTGSTYDEALTHRSLGLGALNMTGASGYFSAPSQTLDPHLFSGLVMHPEVRDWVLSTLYRFWSGKYLGAKEWSRVWIAGSGVTYQWSAGRESGGAPGDLDTLVGVDFPRFREMNPAYRGFDEASMSEVFNDQFRNDLDLHTNNATLPRGGQYEVTFYVNPGATDIRAIHPYAAYDLTDNRWTVPPITLPGDWGQSHFSQEWWDAIHRERDQAAGLVAAFTAAREAIRHAVPETPGWLNDVTALHTIIRQGHALFDSIHEERHRAFATGGDGFLDYYNFRWQAHKQDGTVPAMLVLARLDKEAHKDYDDSVYAPRMVIDSDHALRVAMLATQGVG